MKTASFIFILVFTSSIAEARRAPLNNQSPLRKTNVTSQAPMNFSIPRGYSDTVSNIQTCELNRTKKLTKRCRSFKIASTRKVVNHLDRLAKQLRQLTQNIEYGIVNSDIALQQKATEYANVLSLYKRNFYQDKHTSKVAQHTPIKIQLISSANKINSDSHTLSINTHKLNSNSESSISEVAKLVAAATEGEGLVTEDYYKRELASIPPSLGQNLRFEDPPPRSTGTR